MGCGCKKKGIASSYLIGRDTNITGDPTEWGPILWKYLHCIAEKIGCTENTVIDTDQASCVEFMITYLPNILPCTECQIHAKQYLVQNPLPHLKGLYGRALKSTIRQWLLTFHNAVRTRAGQPIMILTEEQCSELYKNSFIARCEYNQLVDNVAYATRQTWVKIDLWKKWYMHSERLRVLIGDIIV